MNTPPDTNASSPGDDEFWPETRDSWITGLSESARRAAVLEAMSAAYHRPLIRAVRASLPSLGTGEAEDIVQQFFADDIFPRGMDGHTLFDQHDPRRGRLRSLLRASLKNFISSWLRARNALKRGGSFTRVELTECDSPDGYLPHSIDAAFDREWALEVFSRAFKHVEKSYTGTPERPCDPERTRRYHALKPWLIGYQEDQRLNGLAAELGTSPDALRQFLHRLREEWHSALRAVVAPTVASPEQVEEEFRYLCEILRG